MKDKRNYLKIGSIIGVLYTIYLLIDIFFIKKEKSNDVIIGNTFVYIINIVFSVIMFMESRKDINKLKSKKALVIISSIWLFLLLILPGIFGFVFLGSLGEKKKLELPNVTENINKKDYVKYIFLLTFFVITMFILPYFIKFNFGSSLLTYLVIFIITILVTKKDLKNNFKIFINNKKIYIKFILKRYLYMLLALIVSSIPILLFKGGEQSANQQLLNNMFSEKPIFIFILTVFYAPIVEELIFRLSIKKLINNKLLFILLSGTLFGIAHVIGDFKDISDLLFAIQYSALGMCLAYAYYDTKNIFTSISMHFIQNFIAVLLMLIVQLLGSNIMPMING